MADRSSTSSGSAATLAAGVTPVRKIGGVVEKIVARGPQFVLFMSGLFDAMAFHYGARHFGAALPFTKDEFLVYVDWALEVRVQRVRRERSFLPYQGWALPAQVASMLAQIGEVTTEAPVMKYVPVWPNPARRTSAEEIDARRLWNDITVRIQSAADSVGVLLVDTIERDPKGREDVMRLIMELVTQAEADATVEEGLAGLEITSPTRLLGVHAVHGYQPVDAISAATAVILGIISSGNWAVASLPVECAPGYYIPANAVDLVVDRLKQVRSA